MSAAGLCAALAVLLCFAAARELGAARAGSRAAAEAGSGIAPSSDRADPTGHRSRSQTAWLAGVGLSGRSARAALALNLPQRLRRSGRASELSLGAVLAAKALAAGGGAMLGLVSAPMAPGRIGLLVLFGTPAAGFFAPDAWLEREARRRRRRLVAALPDALDLLAVSAGSGRGPAAGLDQIARAGEGPLAEEMRIAVAELSCGSPLASALAALRARVLGSELATLVAAIERSRRFGSPLAEQLRRQAVSLRRDARRATEEDAARAAPKIQLVVALVLVPSVLLMIGAGLIANAGTLLAGF